MKDSDFSAGATVLGCLMILVWLAILALGAWGFIMIVQWITTK